MKREILQRLRGRDSKKGGGKDSSDWLLRFSRSRKFDLLWNALPTPIVLVVFEGGVRQIEPYSDCF